MKINLKYKKNGTIRFYRLMCWLRLNGFERPIVYRRPTIATKDAVFESFRKHLVDERTSRVHVLKHIRCYFGFHAPYSSRIYPSCWVCGQQIFEDNKKNSPL